MSKKSCCWGILFLFLLSANIFAQEMGDVDGSGRLTIVDSLLIAQNYIGIEPAPPFNASLADVNGDNVGNIVDSLLIAQYYVGLIDWPPAGMNTPEPETPTPVIDPTPVTGIENVINGAFVDGVSAWVGGYYETATGSLSVTNGVLRVGITNGGTASWNVQVNQGSINIERGKNYVFSFDARSDAPRTIEANVGMISEPYTSYFASGPLSLTTTMTKYSFNFAALSSDNSARVEFNCGIDSADLYFDNVSLITLGGSNTPEPLEPEIINFKDANLEAALRSQLSIAEGPIYNTDVDDLVSISLNLLKIEDLAGLEYFSGLSKLVLSNNQLRGIEALAGLDNLRELNLGVNFITDISPLENLTNITLLNLVVNDITDLSPLANMRDLKYLLLEFNSLEDISPLASLDRVSYLQLNDNKISDITALGYMSNLNYLNLGKNQISDLRPLANLTKVSYLNLCNNPITDVTPLGQMKSLQTLVLDVFVLEDVAPLANLTNLVSLNLNNNNIKDITPLASMTNLNVLFIANNPLDSSADAVIESLFAAGVRVVR
ncbi:MAG: leucine-rich repeat domain-containing protein [Spirochaetales bacterium]|nr:leucine-rich repeat domain-containing protein [Spirochaetales bacterium]